MGICSAVTAAFMVPPALADDLTDQRDQVKAQQAAKKRELNESSRALNVAADAVDAAESQLAAAQAALAQTRIELATARRVDAAMAAKLKAAEVALAKAKAAVKANQKKLDAEKVLAGQMVRDQYQQQTNLLPVALLMTDTGTADLQTRIQWSTTMFDTTAATIDRTEVLQAKLDAAKAKQAAIEKEIAADRKKAAANLVAKRQLETQATQQQAGRRLAALAAAVGGLAGGHRGRPGQAGLHQAHPGARERRAADRRPDRQGQGRGRAQGRSRAGGQDRRRQGSGRGAGSAQGRGQGGSGPSSAPRRSRPMLPPPRRRAARARATTPATPSSSRRPKKSKSDSELQQLEQLQQLGRSASHGFSYPVNAPITSPYGMRFHPILKYWKLHDGTDFGAGCGQSIRAPYSGKVVEKYYNAGYGNRLIVDHGVVDGQFVTTAYNHAIRYTVGVGDHVSKGEVIGYVGTTGYSTGCHLHLMVYLDGKLRNPMTWF